MSARLLIRRERAALSLPELPELVSGWPLKIERPQRGNRLKISVETGYARLIWPQRVTAAAAVAFFEQHRTWLQQTVRVYRQAEDRATADLALDPRWPGRVPWFGRLLPIHFEPGSARLDIDTHALRCRLATAQPPRPRSGWSSPVSPTRWRCAHECGCANMSRWLASAARPCVFARCARCGAACHRMAPSP